jgi:hypothetical protein
LRKQLLDALHKLAGASRFDEAVERAVRSLNWSF